MVEEGFWIILGNIATAAALIFVGYETLKHRQERKIIFRAWVGDTGSALIPFRVFNPAGESRKFEEWEQMSQEDKAKFTASMIEAGIKVKNFGQAPAVYVRGRQKIVNAKPSRKDILSAEFGPPFFIMPQAEQFYLFFDQGAHFYTAAGNTVYLILEIKYSSAGSKDEKSFGFIAEWTRGGYKIIDSWDETSFNA